MAALGVSARNSVASAASARLAWVDTAKGVCIILVVMMHSTLGLGRAVGEEGWLHAVVAFAQPFRIPAFFLLAGLFLARTIDAPWRRFLDSKVLHFVYFYLLWTFIQIGFKALPTEGLAALPSEFALALIEPFGTLWFIYLLPMFFVVTKLARHASVWLVLAAAAALNAWSPQSGWLAIDEFAHRYVFFFAGYAFGPLLFAGAAQAQRAPDIAIAGAGAAFGLIAAAVALASGDAEALGKVPGLGLLLGALGAAALIGVAGAFSETMIGKAVRYCGERSIVIYLAFFLPMAAARIALVHSGLIGSQIDVGAASALVTLLAIVIPLALQRIVADGPLRFLFQRPDWAHLRERETRTLQPAS